MSECDYCNHAEMCGWRKDVEEQGCEFFDDGNKWIPCEERLPNEKERVESYIRDKKASEFIVTIKEANRPTTLYLSWDNYWFDENRSFYEVIAWMPLPEPYMKGADE